MTTPTSPTQSRQKRLIRWLLEGLLLLLAIYLIHLWQTWDSVKGMAPALTGATLMGDSFSLEQKRAKPLLVYFWASWCPVCGISSGNIDELSQHYNVITVAMQSGKKEEVMSHLEEESLSFPVIVDADGRISSRWQVKGVPTVYIVDDQNRIRSTTVGFTTSLGLRARMWLAER